MTLQKKMLKSNFKKTNIKEVKTEEIMQKVYIDLTKFL